MKTGIIALCAAATISVAGAQTVTISSTKLQSNFDGATGAGQSAPITSAPFSFAGQPQLMSIDSITITLSLFDGDTGLGPNGVNETPYPPPGDEMMFGDDDFDVNSFSLVLDGINLGPDLLLNGFDGRADPETIMATDLITRMITGSPSDMNALLLALQDGFLSASVFDSTGVSQSNGFQIPNHNFDRSAQVFATLSITGAPIPEPSTNALLLISALGGATVFIRRQRRHRLPLS